MSGWHIRDKCPDPIRCFHLNTFLPVTQSCAPGLFYSALLLTHNHHLLPYFIDSYFSRCSHKSPSQFFFFRVQIFRSCWYVTLRGWLVCKTSKYPLSIQSKGCCSVFLLLLDYYSFLSIRFLSDFLIFHPLSFSLDVCKYMWMLVETWVFASHGMWVCIDECLSICVVVCGKHFNIGFFLETVRQSLSYFAWW